MALKIMGRVGVRARFDGEDTEDAEIEIAYGANRASIGIEDEAGNAVTLYIDDFTSLSELAEHLTRASKGEGGVR